ncbi:MAG: hypothetical protein KGJ62_03790 [Armatimonadetes bacterium]|nr:hypothetical protein [Armatimonadota bacterium]
MERFQRIFGNRMTLAAAVLAVAALIGICPVAGAQSGGGGGGGGGTVTVPSAVLTNGNVTLTLNGDGSFGLTTTASNSSDPSNTLMVAEGATLTGSLFHIGGSFLYLRIDGGLDNFFATNNSGWDDVFGSGSAFAGTTGSGGGGGTGAGGTGGTGGTGTTTLAGAWIEPPSVIGNHIEAVYGTNPQLFTTTKNGTTTYTVGYLLQVSFIGNIIHDTARFQFTVKNLDPGNAHQVAMDFVQDVHVLPSPTTVTNASAPDGPLIVPGQPYLHHETEFYASQIPQYWQAFHLITPATSTTPETLHSLMGTLRPTNSFETDPTPPTRFAYGRSDRLNGEDLACLSSFTGLAGPFDCIWNFTPDPSIVLDQTSASPLGPTDASVALYWDPSAIAPGGTQTYVTYMGQADATSDFGQPMSLSVSGPIALSLVNNVSNPSLGPQVTPNPFLVTAYVQNLTDLLNSTGVDEGPVNVFINPGPGLQLANGDQASQTISSLGPGTEGVVSWHLQPTGAQGGSLTYSVTATPSLGNGKIVQRSVLVPSPQQFTLVGNSLAKGLFQMVSIPEATGTTLPSTILFPGIAANPPLFDLVRFDTPSGNYLPVNSFVPGQAYWIRSRLPQNHTVTINVAQYPPLPGQTQPNNQTYKMQYGQGWNQIGNPYVYPIRFSEIQVFDPSTVTLVNMAEAADSIHQWVVPVVYPYNTSDPNPANWHYDLVDNFGFDMQPFTGYWLYVNKPGLDFIYNGVDTPGAGIITQAALLGSSLGATLGRDKMTNWRQQLSARGADSSDTVNYIGVAPNATDRADIYKYPKPPVLAQHVALDIVHNSWGAAGQRFAQDLRSPMLTKKVWNLMVHSSGPTQPVTISWPGIASSVPRGWSLELVDTTTGAQRNMRSSSSYTVTTNQNGMQPLEIVATPTTANGAVSITSFDVTSGPRSGRAALAGSVQIHYAMTRATQAQITIKSSAGRTIRTLEATTRAVAAGGVATGDAVWDLRDNRGVSVPPGLYNVELQALASDGSLTRQIRPYLVVR